MAKWENPTRGGSYLRNPDGSLRRLTEEEQQALSGPRYTFAEMVDEFLSEDRFSATAVIARMKEAIGQDTDAEFAWITGISQQSLTNRKARNSVPYREAIFISYWARCSLKYLLTGEGELTDDETGQDDS